MMLVINEMLFMALLYSCFCRAVKTNRETKLSILVAFYLLSCAALFATFAPIVMAWRPDAVSLALLAATTLVQAVTAQHWRFGPPEHFQQPDLETS